MAARAKEAKASEQKPRKPRSVRLPRAPKRAFILCRGLIVWVLVFAAAILFTQALRAPASGIFFWFVLLLPPAMLLYLLTARAALKVFMISEKATVEKNAPFEYEFRIINEGPLPYPFTDAYVSLPLENRVRCSRRAVRMALSPFSTYHLKNRITFRYRGTYEIGVDCIYVYDFFGLFGLRVDFGNFTPVYVTPRRLMAGQSEAAALSDVAESNRKSRSSYDNLEVSDVRDYRMGDPLKSVHWKLSSKADDLIVRDYHSGETKTVYVFCDLAARFPDCPPSIALDEEPAARKLARVADSIRTRINGVAERAAARRAARKTGIPSDIPADKHTAVEDTDPHTLAADAFYEDMNEFAADGVVELTAATVIRELEQGNRCMLLWFDRRSARGAYGQMMHAPEDLEQIWRSFATAPLAPADDIVTRLSAMLRETQSARQIFVTASLDPRMVDAFCALPGLGIDAAVGSVEVLLYNPIERYANPIERRRYLDLCAARLAEQGIRFREVRGLQSPDTPYSA